jgi:hypothetical protein
MLTFQKISFNTFMGASSKSTWTIAGLNCNPLSKHSMTVVDIQWYVTMEEFLFSLKWVISCRSYVRFISLLCPFYFALLSFQFAQMSFAEEEGTGHKTSLCALNLISTFLFMFNPATFYWSTCTNHGKWAVMYLCVSGHRFCLFLWLWYWIR